MSEVSVYRCTPRQVRAFISDCLYAGLVPFVQSSPGMGKSSIMKSVANELQLAMIDHRLSTSAPEDLSGLPRFNEQGHAEFAPFAELFPLAGTDLPDGKQGWMLFLDEMNSANKSVQAAAYKLILDRMVGQKHLHENCVITAAGNLSTDRAITNNLSTAMQSRVVHLEMDINFEEWLQDVALLEQYDSRIVAYLSQYPGKLMDFRPDHNEKTFCCPRTWEFMNRLIKGQDVNETKAALYAGTITSGVATEFIQFTKVFQDLITEREIMADPENCRLPTDTSTKWATVSTMLEKVTDKSFGHFLTYTGRLDLSFRILFFRGAMVRNPQLRHHPSFGPAAAALTQYLH